MLEGAFRLIREKGHDYLTARNLAAFLGCSTQPIMYQFPNLDTLRDLTYQKADAFHSEYILAGADLLDGTPIYDIKPYIAYTDSHPDAVSGFADRVKDKALLVKFPENLLRILPAEKREDAVRILEMDPRPAYQDDPERRYGTAFAGFDIRFHVQGSVLTVCEVVPYSGIKRDTRKREKQDF